MRNGDNKTFITSLPLRDGRIIQDKGWGRVEKNQCNHKGLLFQAQRDKMSLVQVCVYIPGMSRLEVSKRYSVIFDF